MTAHEPPHLARALMAQAICFVNHRIKFDVSEADRARMQAALDAKNRAAGKKLRPWSNSPTHGNYFAYLGPRVSEFRRVFGEFGEVR